MNAPALRTCALLVLLALAALAAPALPAGAQERMVDRQEFIDTLGGESAPQPVPGMRLRGPAGVHAKPKEIAIAIRFKFDSTDLADDFSRGQLREAEAAFASPELRGLAFEIGGHTDSQGTEAYNMELSRRRAQAVKDALCGDPGVDCAKLQVKGYGKSQPVAPNDDEAGRAKNRRVVFRRLD